MNNKLIFTRIRVTGDKSCDYQLAKGLNIFKGTNSTGKTTLMWMFDYALGSNSKDFITEIKDSCKYVLLDLEINGEKYSIKREISGDNSNLMYTFETHFEELNEIKNSDSHVYSISAKSKEYSHIGDFFLEKLGLTSRTVVKNKGDTTTCSWRTLMNLIYIPQNGWDGIMPSYLADKIKKTIIETFLGLVDIKIDEIEIEIANIESQINECRTEMKVYEKILSKKDTLAGSDISIATLKKKIFELKSTKTDIHSTLVIKEESSELKEKNKEIEEKIKLNEEESITLKNRLDDLNLLLNEIELDLEKNRVLLKSKKLFSEIPITKCPKCFATLESKEENEDFCEICGNEYQLIDESKQFSQNLFLLMDEKKELTNLISNLDKDYLDVEGRIHSLKQSKIKNINEITRIDKEVISPLLKEIEEINSEINRLCQNLGEVQEINSLIVDKRNEEKTLDKLNTDKSKKISYLTELKSKIKEESKVRDDFLKLFRNTLKNTLSLSDEIQSLKNNYLPLFEEGNPLNKLGKEDVKKSKGIKVILAFYTALIEYSLVYKTPFPKLFIFDTPHQDELDMTVFEEVLNYWISLERHNLDYQIIITGSEFPEENKAVNDRIIDCFHNKKESKDDSKEDKFSIQ